jgi:uncharacterized protein (DUF1810 family)
LVSRTACRPRDDDPFRRQRCAAAQAPVIAEVHAELRAGRKRSHRKWVVFPQAAGLGPSPMAVRFAIGSRAEARADLAHPPLGSRLRDCTALVLAVRSASLADRFGAPDDAKFRSSMPLFARTALAAQIFRDALERSCAGVQDPATLTGLQARRGT